MHHALINHWRQEEVLINQIDYVGWRSEKYTNHKSNEIIFINEIVNKTETVERRKKGLTFCRFT